MQTFKVLIIDPSPENRVELKKLIYNIEQAEKTIESNSIQEGIQKFSEENCEIILINADSEEIADNQEKLDELNIYASSSVIIGYSALSATDSTYALKIAVLGAKFVLEIPFNAEKVVTTISKAFQFYIKKRTFLDKVQGEAEARVLESKTYTIFSTKGGVGRTLFSVNLAIAIKRLTNAKVAILDLDLQFGDVSIMMNIKPKKTIIDIAKELSQGADIADLDMDDFLSYFTEHESGVSVLPAPLKPEESELVVPEYVEAVMKRASEFFHYIIIDSPNHVSETILTALLPSDKIIVLLTMELPTIKNGKLMLELMQKLNIPKEKYMLVMNRYNPKAMYSIKDIEDMLEFDITSTVPSEGMTVMPSVENGEPFMFTKPDSPIGASFMEMAKEITGYVPDEEAEQAAKKQAKKKGFFSK